MGKMREEYLSLSLERRGHLRKRGCLKVVKKVLGNKIGEEKLE